MLARRVVVLHDNGQVSGLCATGSADLELRAVFVADGFTYRSQPDPTQQPGRLYRLPTRSIFTFTVATIPLGIARGGDRRLRPVRHVCQTIGDRNPLAGAGPITTLPDRSTGLGMPCVLASGLASLVVNDDAADAPEGLAAESSA